LIANQLDLFLDFVLSLVSVVLNYASPYFLKRILDAAANPTPEALSRAYIYAILSFVASLLKAQSDIQHLWFGRRAGTRIRSQLMMAVYDKALRRKDFSGITSKDDTKGETMDKDKGAKDQKADNKPKDGADVGKIVQLMGSDANRCSMMVILTYMLYG
jgi:ABC-type multidrug transport system fused ATPase/permease subunit